MAASLTANGWVVDEIESATAAAVAVVAPAQAAACGVDNQWPRNTTDTAATITLSSAGASTGIASGTDWPANSGYGLTATYKYLGCAAGVYGTAFPRTNYVAAIHCASALSVGALVVDFWLNDSVMELPW